jgi:PEP-CTERM motif
MLVNSVLTGAIRIGGKGHFSMKNIRKTLLALAVTVGAVGLASPAAAVVPVDHNNCGGSLSLPTPDAADCSGYYSGNVLNGSADDVAAQQNAVSELGGSFDGDWTALVNAGDVITSLTNTNELNFGTTLFGDVIIGAHFGNITDPLVNPDNNGRTGNVSVFWLFHLLTPTDHISLDNTQGFSNAALYQNGTPGVPEPATWAMMLLGFGAAGVAMRRSRKPRVVSQLA